MATTRQLFQTGQELCKLHGERRVESHPFPPNRVPKRQEARVEEMPPQARYLLDESSACRQPTQETAGLSSVGLIAYHRMLQMLEMDSDLVSPACVKHHP